MTKQDTSRRRSSSTVKMTTALFRTTVRSVSGVFDQTEYRPGQTVVITVAFDNEVDQVSASVFGRGALAGASIVDGVTQVHIQQDVPSGETAGPIDFAVDVLDANGNFASLSASNVVTGDHAEVVWPSVTLTVDQSLSGSPNPSTGNYPSSSIVVRATFDQVVGNVDTDAFVVESSQPLSATSVDGSGRVWFLHLNVATPLHPASFSVGMPASAGTIRPENFAATTIEFSYEPVAVALSLESMSAGQIQFVVETAYPVTGLQASSFVLDAGGIPTSARLGPYGSDATSDYISKEHDIFSLVVDTGSVEQVEVFVTLPEAPAGVWPEVAGPTTESVQYDCGASDACVHDTEYFAFPTGDIFLDGFELHASSLAPVVTVVWSFYSGATEPVWFDDGEGGLMLPGDVEGGLYEFRAQAVDVDGITHSVRVAIDVQAVFITSHVPEDVIYTGESVVISWDTSRVAADQYVRVSVRGDFDGDGATTALDVIDETTLRADRMSWEWEVPARLDTELQYTIHLIAISAGTPVAASNEVFAINMVVPVNVLVSPWDFCSVGCGVGEQQRTLGCEDIRSDARLPLDVCSRYFDLPETTQACDMGSCVDPAWAVVGTWTACDVLCGGGVQTRSVVCQHGQDILPDSSCDPARRPASELLCNNFPCDTYTWQAGSWSSCSADCGDGFEERDVFCMSENLQTPVQDGYCDPAERDAIAFQRPCNMGSCNIPYFETGEWSVCSQECGSGNSFRSVLCWFNSETPSTPSTAEDCVTTALQLGIAVADPVKACNSAPCVSYSYLVGSWSECSAACDGGVRSRTLECAMTGGGDRILVDVSECDAHVPDDVTAPEAEAQCNTESCELNWCDPDTPCSNRGVCDPADGGACTCYEGYSGSRCQINAGCPDGTVEDSAGECCESRVLDSEFQLCCHGVDGSFPALDNAGQCCPSGNIDACGVCDGPALVVDATGTCCNSVLDASGLCCESGAVDICGVCDGTNSCPTVAFLGAALSPGMSVDDAYSMGIVDDFSESVRVALGLDETFEITTDVSGGGGGGDGGGGNDGEDGETGTRRRLQGGEVSLEVTVVPLESTLESGLERRMMGISDVESEGIQPGEVMSVGRQPECGNGVCETGERCSSLGQADCCAVDCPYLSLACPTGEGFTEMCSGRGRCTTGTGECTCFSGSGWGGDACDQCAEGFEDFGDGECRVVFVPEPLGQGVAGQGGGVVVEPVQKDEEADSDSTMLIVVVVMLAGFVVFGGFLMFSSRKPRRAAPKPTVHKYGEVKVGSATPRTIPLSWLANDDGEGAALVTKYKISYAVEGTGQTFTHFTTSADPEFIIGSNVGVPPSGPLEPGTVLRDIVVAGCNDVGEEIEHLRAETARTLGLPGRCTSFRDVATTPTSVLLSWTAPTSDGGDSLVGYEIAYTDESGLRRMTATKSLDTRFILGDESGEPAVPVFGAGSLVSRIVVRALNSSGPGPWSAPVTDVELVQSAPTMPAGVTVGAPHLYTVPLSWTSPFGVPVATHTVTYTVDGEQISVDTRSADPEFVIGGGEGDPASSAIAPGTEVTDISVIAIGLADGAGSDPCMLLNPASTMAVASKPTAVTATAEADGTVHVAWKTPSEAASPITGYEISYTVATDDGAADVHAVRSMEAHTDTGKFVIGSGAGEPASDAVPEGSKVSEVAVAALTEAGTGPKSAPVEPRFADARTVPGIPEQLEVADTREQDGTALRLSWQAPGETGGLPIASYRIVCLVDGEERTTVATLATSESGMCEFLLGGGEGLPVSESIPKSATVTGIQVSAQNEVGTGPAATASEVVAAPPAPPAAGGAGGEADGASEEKPEPEPEPVTEVEEDAAAPDAEEQPKEEAAEDDNEIWV